MVSSNDSLPFEEIWGLIVRETRHGAHDMYIWLERLSDMQRLIGLVVFALILLILAFRPHQLAKRKKKSEKKQGSEFFYAVVIVMIFAFGIGWGFDSGLDVEQLMRDLF
ncbi:hypothetical protein [Hyphomonas oceanitis]|uniref:hypothetical protein n=1 Tax=Hyphomonas oceanitis TaxID=81033 RepID=UPI003002F426